MTKKRIDNRRVVFSRCSRATLRLSPLYSCSQNPTFWGGYPLQIEDLLTSNTIGMQPLALPMVTPYKCKCKSSCNCPKKIYKKICYGTQATLRFGKVQDKRKEFSMHQLNICKAEKEASLSSKNILQIINGVRETINKKKLVLASNNIVCAVSGGQDSIFLLFSLSLLRSQIAFKCNIIWCNHFWQACSFYTTLHLTKSAVAFSSPIVGALPSQMHSSSLFYKIVRANYKKDSFRFAKQSKLLKKTGDPMPTKFLHGHGLQVEELLRHPVQIKELQEELQKDVLRDRNWCTIFRCQIFNHLFEGCRHSIGISPPMVTSYNSKIYYGTQARSSVNGGNHLMGKIAVMYQMVFTDFCFAYKMCKSKPIFTKNGFGRHALLAVPLFCLQDLSAPPYKRPLCKGYKEFVEGISEVRARNWRHIITERVYTFYGSKACVYGHTGSDRVETILFNLIRGSGSRGVATLPWKRKHSDFFYNRFFPSCKQVVKATHLVACTTKQSFQPCFCFTRQAFKKVAHRKTNKSSIS